MSRRLFTIVAALVVALLPAARCGPDRARAPSPASSATRRARAIPGATVRVVNEDTGATVEAVSNEQGAYRADALAPGRYRLEATLDGFETAVRAGRARSRSDGGDRRDADPGAIHRSGGRDRPARRGSRAGSADSGVGGERRPRRRRRRLQREPPEGADPDGPVLFDQSAQLGDQHPRPGRAVRAHQRRHRAGRRSLHRRRLLRPSRRGDARLPRRRADRGAARTAGNALRQEHDRRRHQRHDPQAQLHAGDRLRAQLRQPRIRSGEGLDHRAARAGRSPGGCRSPAPSATARSTTPARRTT